MHFKQSWVYLFSHSIWAFTFFQMLCVPHFVRGSPFEPLLSPKLRSRMTLLTFSPQGSPVPPVSPPAFQPCLSLLPCPVPWDSAHSFSKFQTMNCSPSPLLLKEQHFRSCQQLPLPFLAGVEKWEVLSSTQHQLLVSFSSVVHLCCKLNTARGAPPASSELQSRSIVKPFRCHILF